MNCDASSIGRPVEADDDVAGPHARDVRVGSLLHTDDHGAVRVRRAELLGDLRRQRLQRDAGDGAALDLAELDQVVHHVPREVARDGEADALVAAGLAEDGGVDADELAARVDQRAAGVARVDGGVGLDEVLVGREPPFEAAPGRADDAERDGLIRAGTDCRSPAPTRRPSASTSRPTAAPAGCVASIFSTAMSVASSTPTIFAGSSRLSRHRHRDLARRRRRRRGCW